ncbi:MAG: T9SS type A sorting domain-containing protein [Rhodothermaceae bacterium]|nr:T9SS type A sorting domain-containing protein [Rhodothermaceae bacterium]
MKRILQLTFMLLMVPAFAMSQTWNYGGVWDAEKPEYSVHKTNHGIAVDPDGKIWIGPYYRTALEEFGEATVNTIHVYNPDGTETDFSPISTVTVDGVTDTLRSVVSGLATDHNGNILASVGGTLYHINYQTGEGVNKRIAPYRILPTEEAPAGSRHVYNTLSATDAGFILVTYVFEGSPVEIIAEDFSDVLTVANESRGFARTSRISPDGTTIYNTVYTKHQTEVWFAQDGVDDLDGYALTDSIALGMQTESAAWNPATGELWLSAGSVGNPPNQHPDSTIVTDYKPFTYYAYNPDTGDITEKLTWQFEADDIWAVMSDPRPRAIDFANDGKTVWVGAFGSQGQPSIQYFEEGPTSIVDSRSEIPAGYELGQNYPNPFNPTTKISFSIPESADVTLKVYDITGREIATLVNQSMSAGTHTAQFNAANVSSGMYIYRMEANGYTMSGKMMLVK